jgi:hypothetical protein
MKPCVRCADNRCEGVYHSNCANEPLDGYSRYSLGIYAGRYCDDCWDASGYRKEGAEGYDYMDAGEHYDESDAY